MGKTTNIQSFAVARLFSPSIVGELARKGYSPLFSRLLIESNLLKQVCKTMRVYNLFEEAFEWLKCKSYRHEYSYKAALTNQVLLGKHSLQDASMLTELRVDHCRADLVILNGTSTVYEIKSERDSLDRLPKQIKAFREVFANVNVIVGENHIQAVLDMIDQDIGVMCLSDKYEIEIIQESRNRASQTNPVSMFDTIRMRESELLLNDLGISVPDVPNTRKYQVLRTCFIDLDPVNVHDSMVRTLLKTRCLKPLDSLIKRLPSSLHSVVLSMRLRKKDYSQLVESMQTSISKAITWA
ncbi:MAG: sce7726 family protein [Bacteroidetes bacterium]|nr:sce7726 family protein [Bacteroidota bacterium]